MMNTSAKMAPAFTGTTPKERAMLDYVDAYAAAFQSLYPQRRPPMLAPRNECGVVKFM